MEVITIDLQFRNVEHGIAAYVVIGQGGPVLIETGPGSTLKQLLSSLKYHGIAASDIRHVFVTHIHLDHAGAAGWWSEQGAKIYVHQRGARHLVDPSRLLGSAKRIYGENMDSLWGPMLPVPAGQLNELCDNDVVEVNGLHISALDTPGHAYHHLVLRIGDYAFCGDVAGVSIPGARFVMLPTPPPEFDVSAWQSSLVKLSKIDLERLYLTHFGCVEDVPEHLSMLTRLLDDTSEVVRRCMYEGMDRQAIIQHMTDRTRRRLVEAGLMDAILSKIQVANPVDISVDGIMRYWDKRP